MHWSLSFLVLVTITFIFVVGASFSGCFPVVANKVVHIYDISMIDERAISAPFRIWDLKRNMY